MRPASYARLVLATLALTVAGFAALYGWASDAYARALREDGPVEWATVLLLAAGAALALGRARNGAPARRFHLALAVFLVLAALEEMSWGQRLLGIDSPGFFLRHSDQREINLHNVFQQWTGVTTKWIAGCALSAYGIVLPLLHARVPALAAWTARRGIVVPQPVLIPGFVAGTLLMLDLPTYDEEEIAELVYALCFVLLLVAPPAPETAT